MRISDWSAVVCSSDLLGHARAIEEAGADIIAVEQPIDRADARKPDLLARIVDQDEVAMDDVGIGPRVEFRDEAGQHRGPEQIVVRGPAVQCTARRGKAVVERRGQADVRIERSEEHTSELQSLMRISYA